MARRKPSLFDNVIERSTRLPWWAALAFAVAAYVWLHGVATSGMAAMTRYNQLGALLGLGDIGWLAAAGQYAVPAFFLLVAALSAYGRYKGRAHSGHTMLGPVRGPFSDITWQQFLVMAGKAFRRKGYTVVQTGRGGVMGKVDLALMKDGKTYLVLCKQWRAIKVGERSVRELHELMVAQGAAGGFVLTTGVFTDNACAFAASHHIELLDGKALQTLISGVRAPGRIFRDPLSVLTTGAPFCPECQSRMVLSKDERGAGSDRRYWRCSRHPDCVGTRPV